MKHQRPLDEPQISALRLREFPHARKFTEHCIQLSVVTREYSRDRLIDLPHANGPRAPCLRFRNNYVHSVIWPTMQPLSRRVILSHREERGRSRKSALGRVNRILRGRLSSEARRHLATCVDMPRTIVSIGVPPYPLLSPPARLVCARACALRACAMHPAYRDLGAPVITPSQRLNVSLVRKLCEQTRSGGRERLISRCLMLESSRSWIFFGSFLRNPRIREREDFGLLGWSNGDPVNYVSGFMSTNYVDWLDGFTRYFQEITDARLHNW